MKKKDFKKKLENGFSLIELLLVMAIISIVASSILVLVSSQRERAHQGKILAELSGVVQPMLTCRADGESVNAPAGSGGGNICGSDDTYGEWPVIPTESGFGSYSSSGVGTSSWYFYVQDASVKICCNSKNSRCTEISIGDACDANNP